MRLLSDGAQNRHVAATKANADSSRSHCVFTCVVESKCIEDGVTSIKTSCLNLVDLAGWSTPASSNIQASTLVYITCCPNALLVCQSACVHLLMKACSNIQASEVAVIQGEAAVCSKAQMSLVQAARGRRWQKAKGKE